MSTLAKNKTDIQPVADQPGHIDLQYFINKFQPSKFKQLRNGIEIRGVSDVQGAAIRARELIKNNKLQLVVVNTAEMASYKAFEVREIDMAQIVADSKKALADLTKNDGYDGRYDNMSLEELQTENKKMFDSGIFSRVPAPRDGYAAALKGPEALEIFMNTDEDPFGLKGGLRS